MSEKLGGNVDLLGNKLVSGKKHFSLENVYHVETVDQTLQAN